MAIALFLGQMQKCRHQIRSRHTFRFVMPLAMTHENKRFPIRNRHNTFILYLAVHRVIMRHHSGMYIGYAHITAAIGIQMRRQFMHDGSDIGNRNMNPQDITGSSCR